MEREAQGDRSEPAGAAGPEGQAAGQLRKLIEDIERGARADLARVTSACTAGRRRAELLEQLAAEVRAWPRRGLVSEAEAGRLAAALREEIGQLERLIQRAATARPIPVARPVPAAPPSAPGRAEGAPPAPGPSRPRA